MTQPPPGAYPGPSLTPSTEQPKYSGRHRDPAFNPTARLGAAILIIAALVVGTAILRVNAEDVENDYRPFSITGDVNEPLDLREMELRVLGIRGSTKLEQRSGFNGAQYETSGVWLLVRVRVRAYAGTTAIRDAMLRSGDGLVYQESQRALSSNGLQDRALQPGIPVEGELVFEVPRNRAGDVTVMVGIGRGADWLDARGEVRIKSNPGTVSGWTGTSQPVSQIAPQVVRP